MNGNRGTDGASRRRAGLAAVRAAGAAGRAAVVSLSFWTAVCLPAVLVGLLLVGIDTPGEAAAFLATASVEVVALAVGRPHSPG